MIAQGWTLAVPTLYSVGLLSIHHCVLGFPRIFRDVEMAHSSMLEPDYILYLSDYQILYMTISII